MEFEGLIVKGYSGFYYVWDGSRTWECSLRGKHRLKKRNFLAGDKVRVSLVDRDKGKAVIEEVFPRRNELVRPSISNVDQAIVVMSLRDPEPDFWLLDRMLIVIQNNLLRPVICFNKADLVSERESNEYRQEYERAGFTALLTSSKMIWGINDLREALSKKISVFAGPSGVGKSSLLNALEPAFSLKTGQISEKLGRGKHTTRHVELLPLSEGGFLADTPGFSQVYLSPDLKKEEVNRFYPDFMKYRDGCRFATCLHRDEPQCAVKEAVKNGFINQKRYQRYLLILEEVAANERRY